MNDARRGKVNPGATLAAAGRAFIWLDLDFNDRVNNPATDPRIGGPATLADIAF